MQKLIKQKKICLNASNLHLGGGVTVASSFFTNLSNLKPKTFECTILTSAKVDNTLSVLTKKKLKKFYNIKYKIFDTFQFNVNKLKFFFKKNKFDVVFTIFGPLYIFNKKYVSIVGFAQALIIYPNNEYFKLLNIFEYIIVKLKFWVQSFFFKKADYFIVELDHVKRGLVRELGISPDKIQVVRNCVSDIFTNPSDWSKIFIPKIKNIDLKLGFVGRNYLHKNTVIFPIVAEILKNNYNINVKFYVTFTDLEWSSCSNSFHKHCYNVGSLEVNQCPNFYKSVDSIVFPSLLESFSVTPLEAMVMGKPLFASNRFFNKEICGSHAYYFDPLSPESLASKIYYFIKSGGQTKLQKKEARKHALSFSNPRKRAIDYVNIINNFVNNNN
jgi:glycosyltransferase involved in cell wall biosynthesis